MAKVGMSIREVAERVGKNCATIGRWILVGWSPGRGTASIVEDQPAPKPRRRRASSKSLDQRYAESRKRLEKMGM